MKNYAHPKAFLCLASILSFLSQVDPFEKWTDIVKQAASSKYLNETKFFFGIVKLKLGVALSELTTQYPHNFREMFRALQQMTPQDYFELVCCKSNFHKIKYFSYKSVPEYYFVKPVGSFVRRPTKPTFSKHMLNLVTFHPCESKSYQTVQAFRNATAMQLCFPFNEHHWPNDERRGIHLTISENSLFHMNLSFDDFVFKSHLWCYTDFVFIKHPDTNQSSPRYVFCGKRFPWTVIYTAKRVAIWVVGRATSRFMLLYQIVDAGVWTSFHVCHFTHCQKNSGCSQDYESSIQFRTSVVVSFYFGKKQLYNVFTIMTKKTAKLKIISVVEGTFYDGPTVQSKKVIFSKEAFIMSSFQATLVTKNANWFGKNNNHNTVSFISLNYAEMCNKYNNTVQSIHLSFDTTCQHSNCVVYQRYCTEQSTDYSFDVTVNSVKYYGPDEPGQISKYGGVAVYFVDKYHQEEEVHDINHNVSVNGTVVPRDRKNQYTVVSRLSTVIVVVVYYYYSQYSEVTAELVLSRTKCVGYFLPVKMCGAWRFKNITVFQGITNMQKYGPTYSSTGRNAGVFLRKNCLVLSMKRNLNSVMMFHKFYKRAKGMHCFESDIHFEMRFAVPQAIREIQYEMYHLHYEIQVEADMFLVEVLEVNKHNNVKEGLWHYHRVGYGSFHDHYENYPHCCQFKTRNNFCKRTNANSHRMTFRANEKNRIHHKIRTISSRHTVPETFEIYTDEQDLENCWGTITMNFLSCNKTLKTNSLVPLALVEPLLTTFCARLTNSEFRTKDARELSAFLIKHGFNVFLLEQPKESWLGHFWHQHLGQKLAVMEQHAVLNINFNRSRNTLYLETNISKKSNNATIKYFVFDCRDSNFESDTKSFEVELPFGFTDIFIPTLHMPFCFLPTGVMGNLCYFDLKVDRSLLDPMNTFHVHSPHIDEVEHKRDIKYQHLHLRPQCVFEFNNCSTEFLSWNEAFRLCKSKGLDLPSVFSSQDMITIKQQTDRVQCRFSLRNLIHYNEILTEIIYQTIGIYIGLNNKVFLHLFQSLMLIVFRLHFLIFVSFLLLRSCPSLALCLSSLPG